MNIKLPEPAAKFGHIKGDTNMPFTKETFSIDTEHKPEFGQTVNLYTEAQVLALMHEPTIMLMDPANVSQEVKAQLIESLKTASRQPLLLVNNSPHLLDMEKLSAAIAEGLNGLYGCSRQWSAWHAGTMTEDDFYAADNTEECVAQMLDALTKHGMQAAPRILGKDRWDSDSLEAQFHKSIRFLTKKHQGYVMGAFRDALLPLSPLPTWRTYLPSEPAGWQTSFGAEVMECKTPGLQLIAVKVSTHEYQLYYNEFSHLLDRMLEVAATLPPKKD